MLLNSLEKCECGCVCACVRACVCACVRAFGRAYVCVSFYILRFDARIESICVFTVARQGIYRIDMYESFLKTIARHAESKGVVFVQTWYSPTFLHTNLKKCFLPPCGKMAKTKCQT